MTNRLIEISHFFLAETSTIVTLQILREQGFVGDISVQLSSKPNFSLLPSNQATKNEDYIIEEEKIIMAEGTTVAYVSVTILPVSN